MRVHQAHKLEGNRPSRYTGLRLMTSKTTTRRKTIAREWLPSKHQEEHFATRTEDLLRGA